MVSIFWDQISTNLRVFSKDIMLLDSIIVVLTRKIGLTVALSLITGIDKKARPYKDKSRLGLIQSNPKVGGGGDF